VTELLPLSPLPFLLFPEQIAQAQKKKDTKKRQTLRGAAIRGLKRKSSNSAAVY
jgi:hypothetical protein